MDRDDSEKLILFIAALNGAGIDVRAAQPYHDELPPSKIVMVGCGDHDKARIVDALVHSGIGNYVDFISIEEVASRLALEQGKLFLQIGGFVQHVPEITMPISLKDLPCVDALVEPKHKGPQDRFSFFDGVGYSRRGKARNQGFAKHFKHK